jgi:hypothetical protein
VDLEVWKVVLQALSSFAIFGGLVYTAVQFKKTREAQHFANFAKLVEMQMHLREMRVTDPSLARVYAHDMEGTHNEREVREYFFNLMQVAVFEIVWFGRRRGQVPEDYYASWERRMRDLAKEASFRKMMTSPSMKIMHDEFQTYMQTMVREANGEFSPTS